MVVLPCIVVVDLEIRKFSATIENEKWLSLDWVCLLGVNLWLDVEITVSFVPDGMVETVDFSNKEVVVDDNDAVAIVVICKKYLLA